MVWTIFGGCFTCESSAHARYRRGRKNQQTEEPTASKLFSESEGRRGSFVIELQRQDSSSPLGIILAGGSDKDCRPKITSFRPGSAAYRCDALSVGDFVTSVNGIRINKLRHDEIIALLQNAGERVTLQVEYDLPPTPVSENPMSVCPKVIQVSLERELGSFGLTLRGGINPEVTKSRPLLVTQVRPGSSADREGTIRPGDRVLAVDNINLSSATLQEAMEALQHTESSALFTVEYDISVLEAVNNATGTLLVELEKVPGSMLGITLTHTFRPEQVLVIESIKQASIAERCGALHVGDQVLAIGDVRVEHMSAAEATQVLRNCSGDALRMEIFPISQILQKRMPFANTKRTGAHLPTVPTPSCCTTPNLRNRYSVRSSSSSPHLLYPPSLHQQYNLRRMTERSGGQRDMTTSASCFSGFLPTTATTTPSTVPGSRGQVCHIETTEVTIQADIRGFGFALQRNSQSPGQTPPVISDIDPNGPAEKTAVLQVGDRVLAVNGQKLHTMSGEEMTQLLQKSRPQVLLEVEFDVAESVVPSSGTFTVKLPKRGASLGITVTSPKNRLQGEPLLISSIKKGSVAHRTGTIQPGDRLLAIDAIRMNNCTVEDAAQILLDCGDIVKLRIRKDDVFSEEPDISGSVVYTVELVRHGGPLGITVSGSEEPFEPIIISGLTEGGIAEKTGAIHVGDRLLAINGHSLRGKPLSEAILLLQNSRDVVTLKISKSPEGDGEKMEKDSEPQNDYLRSLVRPLPSVDSAVESWDSSKVEMSPCLVRGRRRFRKDDQTDNCSSEKESIHKTEGMRGNEDSLSNGTILEECSWDTESNHSDTSNAMLTQCNDPNSIHRWTEDCDESKLVWSVECDEDKPDWPEKVLSEDTGEFHSDLNGNREYEERESFLCAKDLADFKNTVHHLNEQLNQIKACSRSDDNISEITSQLGKLGDLDKTCPFIADQKCNTLPYTSRRCRDRQSYSVLDSSSGLNTENHQQAYPLPLPIEVHQVCLFKDNVYEDFGFSVSDGLYHRGVYVNRIRAGGPAEVSGVLKPFDRILQVNETKTHDFDCCLTVPLIAAAGDKLQLIISRPAYLLPAQEPNMRTSFGLSPWVDEDDQEDCSSPQPIDDLIERITKAI